MSIMAGYSEHSFYTTAKNGYTVGEYRWSNIATVGIDVKTGKAYTAYPNLKLGYRK